MTSLNEISYNILNLLRGGRSSNSEHFSLEQIKFNVNYYRSLLLRRDLERNFNHWRSFEQDLGEVPVSQVDSAESGTFTSGVDILRTDERIPRPLRLKSRQAISHVSNPDKIGQPIPLLDTVRAFYQDASKYTGAKPFSFYRDGYVYVKNDLSLSNLNIRGVFENPEEVHKFTRANGLDLYDADSEYPISADMVQQITQGLLSGEYRILSKEDNDVETDNLQN